MSMVIYCNLCFEIQSEIKRNFVVTSCSHVFCESCQLNVKNFCKLCNAQCKVLEIGKQMPSTVKMFFEEKSIERMAHNIRDIWNFQENQIKFYYEKTNPYAKKYQEVKQHILKLHNVKKKYTETIRKEKQVIERLKQAYRSNKITPELFDLCTMKPLSETSQRSWNPSNAFSNSSRPKIASQVPSNGSVSGSRSSSIVAASAGRSFGSPSWVTAAAPTPYSSTSSRSLSTSSSVLMRTLAHSSKSLFSQSRSDQSKSSSITSNLVPRMMNMNTNTPSPGSSSSPRNIFKDTRKSLLESTLRQMQNASQRKFQATREQFKS